MRNLKIVPILFLIITFFSCQDKTEKGIVKTVILNKEYALMYQSNVLWGGLSRESIFGIGQKSLPKNFKAKHNKIISSYFKHINSLKQFSGDGLSEESKLYYAGEKEIVDTQFTIDPETLEERYEIIKRKFDPTKTYLRPSQQLFFDETQNRLIAKVDYVTIMEEMLDDEGYFIAGRPIIRASSKVIDNLEVDVLPDSVESWVFKAVVSVASDAFPRGRINLFKNYDYESLFDVLVKNQEGLEFRDISLKNKYASLSDALVPLGDTQLVIDPITLEERNEVIIPDHLYNVGQYVFLQKFWFDEKSNTWGTSIGAIMPMIPMYDKYGDAVIDEYGDQKMEETFWLCYDIDAFGY